jgi:hypothetical protein
MSWENPFDDPNCVRRVELSGWVVPAFLVAVDGNELEQKWTVQEAKDKSGATAVWNGQKLVEGLVYTLEAPDRERFASLQVLFDKLKPPPGGSTGGGGSNPAATPTGFTSGSGSTGTPQGAATPSGFSSAGSAPTAAADAKAKGNAGSAKPPTVTIKNLYANAIGVVEVGMKKWKGPYQTKTLSWRVDLTLIQVAPSTKAAGGPANPGLPAGWTSGTATPKDNADKATQDAKSKAQTT